MKPVFQFIIILLLRNALVSPAQSEEIRFETDGFRGEVPNGLTTNKPFLKVHLEPGLTSPSRVVPFSPGQKIEWSASLLRTVRTSEFLAKKWPKELPAPYEAECLPFGPFIRLDEFTGPRAIVKKLVFKAGDHLTLLQYFSEGDAIAKMGNEVCFLNLSYFTVSPDSDELPNTENWIKLESIDNPEKGSWLLIDDNIECL